MGWLDDVETVNMRETGITQMLVNLGIVDDEAIPGLSATGLTHSKDYIDLRAVPECQNKG